ncbi:MAG: SUMF1/EgtB/PvdO family nonheme iron enzyme [Treponema sp.]|jgi:hypothetical protein|nr:SUMF1/EgtB/PvdO family nonheme iron enzyme [Treponema sp.]
MPQKKPEKEVLDTDKVILKPFMGIKPGIYLACLYAIIILAILFFILLYPGISNPGSVLSIKTEPQGAAVLLDGVYTESSPCEVYAPKGVRKIDLILPGFTAKQVEIDVRGRLFASILFPLKTEIRERLESPSPIEAFNDYAAEYAAWTFTGEPSAAYQVPLSLSEGTYRLGPEAKDPIVRKSMEETIIASSRFAVTRAALRDLIRAKTLLDNQGLSPSPITLLSSAEDIIGFLEENPMAALWLESVLIGESKSVLTNSSWYKAAAWDAPADSVAIHGSQTIQAGSLRFQMINGGMDLLGKNFPPGTTVNTFYISETEISVAAWEAFLEKQPRWKKENTEALIKEGMVKEEYLESAAGQVTPPGADVISGVSWYAAKAFCEWLTQQYDFPGMEIRLPTEAEWEYAAKAGAIDHGRFWEWCGDPFVPLSYLTTPSSAVGSPERPLRGGSWINIKGTVDIETRGSLPPSFCSPFVSFRPVIGIKQ